MHWIVVCNESPYPPNSGGRMEVYGKIISLLAAGDTVELVIAGPREVADDELARRLNGVCRIVYWPKVTTLFTLLNPIIPYQIASRRLRTPYDVFPPLNARRQREVCVLCEGLYVSEIALEISKLLDCPIVYRAHNIEAQFYKYMFQAGRGLKKLYYLAEASRMKHFERTMVSRFKLIASISPDEITTIKKLSPGARVNWIPPFVSVDTTNSGFGQPCDNRRSGKLLYVGALDRVPNEHGLLWFIKNVWQRFDEVRANWKMVVVGRNPTSRIRAACSANDIELHPNVSSVTPFYQDADIVINPVFFGTGVNIKTIEAVFYGKPYVTTSTGARGTGLRHRKHIVIADTPSEFASALTRYSSVEMSSMALKARQFIAKTCDPEKNARRLARLVRRTAFGKGSGA